MARKKKYPEHEAEAERLMNELLDLIVLVWTGERTQVAYYSRGAGQENILSFRSGGGSSYTLSQGDDYQRDTGSDGLKLSVGAWLSAVQ